MKNEDFSIGDSSRGDFSRRRFIKGVAVSAAGFMIVPRHVLGGKGYLAPSDKITVGMIGVGGKGRQNTGSLLELEDVQVTCLADPAPYWALKDFYYRSKAGRLPVKEMVEAHYQTKTPSYRVKEYLDFREMLEQEIGRASCRERVCQYVEISVVAVS